MTNMISIFARFANRRFFLVRRMYVVLTLWTALLAPAYAADVPKFRVGHAAWDAQDPFDTYLAWKLRYLRQGSCRSDERYINSAGDAGKDGDITVSEAHGYGMRALVAMADRDADAHADFDRMVNLMVRSNVQSGLSLMTWRLTGDCMPADKEPSAADGDMDMAYALLAAEARWGNSGAHDYGALARQKINAVMNHVVQNKDTGYPIIGLWEDMNPSDPHFGGTRSSDYMMGHFGRFASATGDERWNTLADNGYRMLLALQKCSSSGLVPDFIVTKGASVHSAPQNYLEGDLDGGYGFNACRVPWRLAAAVRATKDPRAVQILRTLTTALMEIANHDPHALLDGYRLSGWDVGKEPDRLAFVAPAAVGLTQLSECVVDASNWRLATRTMDASKQGYFNETVRLMTLLP